MNTNIKCVLFCLYRREQTDHELEQLHFFGHFCPPRQAGNLSNSGHIEDKKMSDGKNNIEAYE